MFTKRVIIVGLVGIVFIGLSIPYETVIVPEWTVRFVDEDDRPVVGLGVEQVCQHYTYSEANICAQYQDSKQVTKSDGSLTFSSKSVRYSAASRGARAVFHYITLLAHGSVGPEAYLILVEPEGYEPRGLITYEHADPASKVFLRSKGGGGQN